MLIGRRNSGGSTICRSDRSDEEPKGLRGCPVPLLWNIPLPIATLIRYTWPALARGIRARSCDGNCASWGKRCFGANLTAREVFSPCHVEPHAGRRFCPQLC